MLNEKIDFSLISAIIQANVRVAQLVRAKDS